MRPNLRCAGDRQCAAAERVAFLWMPFRRLSPPRLSELHEPPTALRPPPTRPLSRRGVTLPNPMTTRRRKSTSDAPGTGERLLPRAALLTQNSLRHLVPSLWFIRDASTAMDTYA